MPEHVFCIKPYWTKQFIQYCLTLFSEAVFQHYISFTSIDAQHTIQGVSSETVKLKGQGPNRWIDKPPIGVVIDKPIGNDNRAVLDPEGI